MTYFLWWWLIGTGLIAITLLTSKLDHPDIPSDVRRSLKGFQEDLRRCRAYAMAACLILGVVGIPLGINTLFNRLLRRIK